jgi:hypothetical protein
MGIWGNLAVCGVCGCLRRLRLADSNLKMLEAILGVPTSETEGGEVEGGEVAALAGARVAWYSGGAN